MTSLTSLFSQADFAAAKADELVRLRQHPDADWMWIANYTEKAAYTRTWNPVTLNCRGLIFDDRDGTILARPWPKFFNLGEPSAGEWDHGASVEVTDKMDGSLGILYTAPDGRKAIATRGSFESEQAIVGSEILRDKYGQWRGCDHCTYLFEIVYPENRIVVDYGGQRDLILLGMVDLDAGEKLGPTSAHSRFPGPTTRVFPARTLGEALAMPPRKNAEGVVVRSGERMVKIKQADYVALHKIVTGLSERSVWEHLAAHDGRYTELLASVPDEFHGWVDEVAAGLIAEHSALSGLVHAVYHDAVAYAPEYVVDLMRTGPSRRHFAYWVRENHPEMAGYLFSLLDGKDISPAIWKALKPKGYVPMRRLEEGGMTELVITRGYPGSGKTTFARNWVGDDLANRARVNRDDTRHNLYGVYWGLTHQQESTVSVAQRSAVEALLRAGQSVVVDDTNLRLKVARKWATLAQEVGAAFEVVDLRVPADVCIERDAARERQVGAEVIRMFACRYPVDRWPDVHPSKPASPPTATYEPDRLLPRCWLFDIDGTLAHMGERRGPYDEHLVGGDEVDATMARLLRVVRSGDPHTSIVVLSGRTEGCREATERWLRMNYLPFDELHMRQVGDQRKDSVVKAELFDREVRNRYHALGVFDDRQQVVDMWRGMGLKCLQVQPGDF